MSVSQSFATKVAAKIGADPAYVFQIFNQWEPWENANAAFNPLATTQHAAGSKPLGGNPNQNGGNPVQEYPNEDVGAAATAQTLLNGHYPNLVKGLQNGNVDASAAPEVRVWGTTGFANQLEGGPRSSGSGSTASAASTAAAKRLAELQAAFDSGMANEPPEQNADGDTSEHDSWYKKMTLLNSAISSATTAAGQKDTGFANQLASTDEGIKIDTLNQNRDSKEIERFLGGLQESRQRADQIAAAKKEIRMYGTPAGKSSYSYNDLGAGFAQGAIDRGIDPSKALVNYGGTVNLDPEADMARFDSMFGTTGAIPSMGQPQSQFSNIPQFDPGLDPGTDPSTLGSGFDMTNSASNSVAESDTAHPNGNLGFGLSNAAAPAAVGGASKPPPWVPSYATIAAIQKYNPSKYVKK